MKKLLAVLFIVCFIIPSAAHAAPTDTTIQEDKVYEGQIQLEDQKYPLSQYRLETSIDGGGITGLTNMGEKGMAGLNDGLWSVNKQIANFTSYAVTELLTYDLISKMVDSTAQISNNIYDSMSGLFLSFFISIAAGTAAYRFFVNRQEASAWKAIGGTLLIMVTMTWYFSNTTQNIQLINNISSEIDGKAMSTNVMLSNKTVDTSQPTSSNEGTALLRNQIFELMIYKPYLLLQYGTTKESDITSNDPNRIVGLLSVKTYNKDALEQRKKIVDNEVNALGNVPMSPGFAGERFGQIFLTVILTCFVSVPILIMAATAFLLQVFLLCLLIFAAIPLVMSVIPSFAATSINFFKKLWGLIFHKAALTLIISVAMGISTFVYNAINLSSGLEGYMLLAFVNGIIIFGVFKFRSEILEIVSLGAIAGNNIAERVTSRTIQGVASKSHSAVTKGKDLIAKRIQSKKSSARNRGNEPIKQDQSGDKRIIVFKGKNEGAKSAGRASNTNPKTSPESTSMPSTGSKSTNIQSKQQSPSRKAMAPAKIQDGSENKRVTIYPKDENTGEKPRVSIYPSHSTEKQVAATSERNAPLKSRPQEQPKSPNRKVERQTEKKEHPFKYRGT